MRVLFVACYILIFSLTTFAQNQIAIPLGTTCNVDLKKYGVILPMPCDLKKDSMVSGEMSFKKDYYVDDALAGYVYITVSPNRYKTMDDIQAAKKELLDTYRSNAEELGLDTKLSEVQQSRAQSHLHLAARDFPKVQGNPGFKYMYWIDLLLGNGYVVKYEILAPYNEKVVMNLGDMVRLVDWSPVIYKDSKTGLKMMIPGGDWKASTLSSGNGIQLKPQYLWDNMYSNPRDQYPDVQIIPVPSASSMGFDKAVTQVKGRIEKNGGSVVEDEEIGVKNSTNARFILGKFPAEGKFYSQEYVWLLQLPGNKFMEVIMKATCDDYGCRGQYDVLPLLEKVLIESISY
jgi:hypothetical protein